MIVNIRNLHPPGPTKGCSHSAFVHRVFSAIWQTDLILHSFVLLSSVLQLYEGDLYFKQDYWS